jgi:hypothetical protein
VYPMAIMAYSEPKETPFTRFCINASNVMVYSLTWPKAILTNLAGRLVYPSALIVETKLKV